MKKDATDNGGVITVPTIKTGAMDVYLLGASPLILHHGSVKQHLLPAPKLTRVEKDTTLKHEPLAEFKERMILAPDGQQSRLLFPAAAFKGAMMTAALRMPGVVKTEIAQLVWVQGERVSIYGTPQVFIREVRTADMAHTPDARTRPILGQWATQLEVRYTEPMITPQTVANLIAAAGIICGVGDWRPEKGKGSFGQFEVVHKNDPRYVAVRSIGRVAQDRAIANPSAFDAETLDVLTWYDEELARRQVAGRSQKSRRKPNGAVEATAH